MAPGNGLGPGLPPGASAVDGWAAITADSVMNYWSRLKLDLQLLFQCRQSMLPT
jgi:hypothetical protein